MDLAKLQAQLRFHEGIRKFPYVDTVGKLTIGVGRNLTDNGVSSETINQMLMEDITNSVNFLNLKLSWFKSLDDVRQRALTNMTFNLMGKILDFKLMLSHLKAKEWDQAADELLNSTFAHQVGKRAIDLATMIRTGVDL